jgi:chromosome segregation ATPase
LKHNSSSASASTPYRLDPSLPLQQELLTELQQRIAVVMDENAILVEQKVVLSTELDRQQSLVTKQVKELHELHNTVGELTREIGILRNSIAQLEGERNEAAKHALQCSDMLGKNEQEIEVLQEQLIITQAKSKELESINAGLDKKCRLMSQKYDEEGINVVKKLHIIEERVKELTMLNHQKQSELDTTTDVLRKLRSEYHTTRQDAEGMLQVMNGMEKQLNEYAIREDMINKLQVEAREKLEEAITIKEECIVKEEQSQREIERLMNERKQYLLQRQVREAALFHALIRMSYFVYRMILIKRWIL